MYTFSKAVKVMIVVCAVLLTGAYSELSDVPTRGRVRLNDKTIITDWGTVLHGCCWALDMIKNPPPREDLVAVKQCGVNCVHIYFEKYDKGETPGYNTAKMDQFVEWCREESLYVIMTIGGSIVGPWNDGRQWELNAIKNIWAIYAPRYADQTHVIYEIKNEGCNGTFHCDEPVMQMYHDMYLFLREKAPDTHILLMSHSNLAGGTPSLMEDVERLGPDIDWSNASIAFHGYGGGGGAGSDGGFQEQVIKDMNAAGIGMTMTECWSNIGLEPHYENAQISYMPMVGCFSPMAKQKCDAQHKLNLSYAPDFGSWPKAHVEHVPVQVEPLTARAKRPAARGRSAIVFPFVTDLSARDDFQAVYDLSGRLLWRRTDSSGAANGAGGFAGPKDVGARTLVVRYAD